MTAEIQPETAPRHPVVLVHGMGGFDELRLSFGRTRKVALQYFNGIPKSLQALGVTAVFCPELPATGSIRDRAAALAAFIEKHLAPGARAHLIAHSMGGLDSRDYITRLGGHARALSLTTLGTPHRGSPLAAMICSKLIDPAALLRGLGRAGTPARFAAHRDLTPESCAAFNAATPDREEVVYHSYGGAPSAGVVQWPLAPFYEVLRRLPGAAENDGLVPLASTQWSGWRGATPCDHFGFINWRFQRAARAAFDTAEFYAGLMRLLAETERRVSP